MDATACCIVIVDVTSDTNVDVIADPAADMVAMVDLTDPDTTVNPRSDNNVETNIHSLDDPTRGPNDGTTDDIIGGPIVDPSPDPIVSLL